MKINQLLIKSSLGFLSSLLLTLQVQAQTLSGEVQDVRSNDVIIGASVQVKDTNVGTITDFDGKFSLDVDSLPVVLVIKYVSYTDKIVTITSAYDNIIIQLDEGLKLDEVVVTGSRGKVRTVLTSPVPIDNIDAEELKASGQISINQMINFKLPSFNSTPQAVSDASAHFNPSELRNLGPSRTLVLINGKRKNQSSQVYLNRTTGRGEVGTDFQSIPSAAVERVEILRDGASAQYGSDAVAGVINIILKKQVAKTELYFETGVAYKGDGFNYLGDINHGFTLGENGFLNITGSLFHTDKTNRAGRPGGDGLFGFLYSNGSIPFEAAGPQEASEGVLATPEQILNGDTDWQRANPDLGMIMGIPEQDRYSLVANLGLPYNNGEFYANAGYTFRYGKSFAFYRTPWWPEIGATRDLIPLWKDRSKPFQGFLPTMESDIRDITLTLGNRLFFNDWTLDLSVTHGSNDVQYLVSNSVNLDLLPNSPTRVDPGGYKFSNTLGNLDLFRQFGYFSFTAGTEIRNENFVTRMGEEASYAGEGIQSFPGIQPSNVVDESRANVGVYTGLDIDLSESFLVGGAIRFENFSRIGDGEGRDNLSWKLNARQLLGDNKGAIRASFNSGFRAPSLHQIYLSNIQTIFVGGMVGQQGIFNNVSDLVRVSLGVPQLNVETSINFTAGLTYRLAKKLSATFDYYNISVDDRVLLSTQVQTASLPEGNIVRTNLENDGIEGFAFFTNAADTNTHGIDLVFDLNHIGFGDSNSFGATLAFNWNNTKVKADGISIPKVFAENKIDIFGREEVGRLESSRPNIKSTLALSYKTNNLRFNFNNTFFGEVTEIHPISPTLDQVYNSKIVTDLIIGCDISEVLKINLTANNIFNVYPDELIESDEDPTINFGGRMRYPWHVNQFGFLGGALKLGMAFSF